MSVDYLDLVDFLAISEIVLGQPAEDIAFVSRLELAESALHAPSASFGGVEFYPDLVIKAAVLCTQEHPSPNKPSSSPPPGSEATVGGGAPKGRRGPHPPRSSGVA